MSFKFLAPLVAGILFMTGCQDGQGMGGMGQKQTGGALIGAGVGGLIGSQLGGGGGKAMTTVVGVIAGGLVGSEIGKSLDKADQTYMVDQTNRALETGPTNQPARWRNPDSGYDAQVVPTRTYQQPSGTYCRDYTQSIFIDGQAQTARGTACRQADGTWQTVS